MKKTVRLLLVLMVSLLSAQTATIKNSVINYATIGDTITFDKPYIWSFVKSGDGKWMISSFIDAPWARNKVYVEELFYKPYSDKFTIMLGRQAIPFGSNIPYLDLTRPDRFTYQTSDDVGLLYFGDGVTVMGGVGDWFLETYYGSDIENGWEGLTVARLSYGWNDQYVGLTIDNQDRQVVDVSGYSKYVDYVTEFTDEYQWVRAVVKPNFHNINLIVGYENFNDESKLLYGFSWNYGEPNRFLSTELSADGDVKVKLYYGFNLTIGDKNE
ncbi:hypothetical protein H8D04_00990 [bacterium]|nr:hypothetical protein [bacterium]